MRGRRIERDLHDGAQQRLVSLASNCAMWRRMYRPTLRREEGGFQTSSPPSRVFVSTDLQELSRGIHPAILSKGGLGPAIKVLARRSAIPVELVLGAHRRLPDPARWPPITSLPKS